MNTKNYITFKTFIFHKDMIVSCTICFFFFFWQYKTTIASKGNKRIHIQESDLKVKEIGQQNTIHDILHNIIQ